VRCQIEVIGWVGGWTGDCDTFFVKQYLRKYNSSEIETLRVCKVWWEIDAHTIFDLDCFKEVIKN